MKGTKSERDHQRTEKWLTRSGGFAYVSPEAFDLLSRRLAARNRARLKCAPLALLALAILFSAAFDVHDTASWRRMLSTRTLTCYGLLALTGLLVNGLMARAERRIAESLPARTSRGTAIALRVMLGNVRLAYLVVALAVEAGLAVTLLVVRLDWVSWTFLCAYLVAGAFAALGLRQAATRTTIAVDPISLAIDERLRAEEAFSALYWLFAVLIAFPANISAHGRASLDLLWLGAGLVVYPLYLGAAAIKPWRSLGEGPWVPSATVADRTDPWVKL